MQTVLTFLIMLSALAGFSPVAAQSTPSATPVEPTKVKQIDDLKERLATKVAELRQTQQKAIFGTIKTVSISSVTVETTQKDIKLEIPDELSIVDVRKNTRAKKTIENIVEGDFSVIFGDYDATLDLLNAKLIVLDAEPASAESGIITDVDENAFTISIKTNDSRDVVVDYEKFTVTNSWTTETGVTKSGFSKIPVGSRMHVLGTPNTDVANRITANRILWFTDPLTPMASPTEMVSPTERAKPSVTVAPTEEP